ncbi:hypothetical protein ACP6NG_12380 [Brevibacterium casei]|uniref:Uncharacterized protein n=1 Tax=Brevibacterium casei TaxID=33889 RepID=A0A269ZE76_9MICO|nr:hypothetical protein [Brevibacterium casei]PAK96103.1 hypothetical protein B8X04_07615 [Brevibacterium casei]QPS32735.1 hypothetical protein I6G59_12125 [Brevibacterium casei]VEW11998.1 Uncharacterised protein [Brevibacterium casei]
MNSVTLIDVDGVTHAAVDPAASAAEVEQALREMGFAAAMDAGTLDGQRLVEVVDIDEWRAYDRKFGLPDPHALYRPPGW